MSFERFGCAISSSRRCRTGGAEIMAISIHRWQSVRPDTLPKAKITQRRVTSLSGFGRRGNYARACKVLEGAQERAATLAASLEQKGGSSLHNAPCRVAHSEM